MKLTNPAKDGLLGLVFLVASAVIIFGTGHFPTAAAAFPRLIATSIFAVFGALLIIRGAIQWRTRTTQAEEVDDDPADMSVQFDGRTIFMSLAICASFFGVSYIGFIESMVLLAIVSCIAFRMKLLHAVIYVVLFAAILVAFLRLMGVRLPEGPVTQALSTLLN